MAHPHAKFKAVTPLGVAAVGSAKPTEMFAAFKLRQQAADERAALENDAGDNIDVEGMRLLRHGHNSSLHSDATRRDY